MIEVREICKSYGSGKNAHVALQGINLAFRDNEFVAILGPSGSGKTTLLNVIGGLDHYDAGDLIINHISTKDYSARDWDSYRNHSIGFIFQSYNLIQHQTILSNVEMALTISGISGKKRRSLAAQALESVSLGDHLMKRPNQLSGGQMQRVAIARALVNNPSVVLADEPTGALDSKTSVQVMELLKEVAKDRLIIMVTHNPELAEQYATRIITLKDGEIIHDTDPYLPETAQEQAVSENMGHSSMNIGTALSLSFHNLWAKRSRTLLTAFAGSIGIIGIALIAALSSGVNTYISNQEANMAYQYPLLVETLNMDLSSVLSDLSGELLAENDSGCVEVAGFLERLFATLDTNDLENLKEYLDEDENSISQYGTVEYVYSVEPRIYVEYGDQIKRVCPDDTLDLIGLPISSIDTSLISSSISTNMFYCMPEHESLYLDRYDMKAGRWPAGSDECILVLTTDGKISDYLLYVLGMRDPSKMETYIKEFINGQKVETEELEGLRYEYEDFLGIQFKVINSCDTFTYDEEYQVWRSRSDDLDYMRSLVADGRSLTIVGVVQPKPGYGVGALKAGIDYPFSLVQATVNAAASSEIVMAQLEHPEVDIFTGTSFHEQGTARDLDPASLVDVDLEQIKASIQVDQELVQKYFLEGANLSAFQIDTPEINLSDILILDPIEKRIREQLEADLPGLIGGIQLSAEDMTSLIKEILADYMAYMKENGYLDAGQIADYLDSYFSSGAFSEIVREWLDTLDFENQEDSYWESKISELSDRTLASLNAYLNTVGLPSLPYFENAFQEYLETGRWRIFVQNEIERLMEANQLEEKLDSYLEGTIKPLIEAAISEKYQAVQQKTDSALNSVEEQVKSGVTESILNGFSVLVENAESCISIDQDRFLSAFSMKLDAQELSDIILSMTNFTKVTLAGNLKKLGYVEMSHPKSIRIYPADFESKDQIIAVLDRYNQNMRLLGEENNTVSYTDTLGAVMTTVTRIIKIITSALIATVAVSLVVSSIMIGVITYISVLERRKEIGILRAMGASRHNVAQIFNAETFITGLLSGCMGIGLAYLLMIPLNAFLHSATEIRDIYAFLPAKYAVFLIIISVILTTLGGIIPAYNASKSDPVEALRTD